MYSWKQINDTPEDRATVQAWLDKDELHQQLGLKVDMLFAPGTESYFVMDDEQPLMAVRFWKAMRFGIQFNPDSPYKSAKAANWVMAQMEEWAYKLGYAELMCIPGGRAVKFAERLGFTSTQTMKKNIHERD